MPVMGAPSVAEPWPEHDARMHDVVHNAADLLLRVDRTDSASKLLPQERGE